MKSEFTLTGTDNNGFRHRYSIKKNEDFKKAFLKFMANLEFEEDNIEKSFLGEDNRGERVKLKISDLEDICTHYENKKYDVDVFYGRFKIIIVVRTKDRTLVVKHLEKKAKWIKPFSVKKIKEKQENSPKILSYINRT
jgi:hypothetical protein